MSSNNLGMSRCKHCGAQYRLFTISNRDMQGLCKAWKGRHEFACNQRTPASRSKWAKKYAGLGDSDSSITVDLNHEGFAGKAHQQAKATAPAQ